MSEKETYDRKHLLLSEVGRSIEAVIDSFSRSNPDLTTLKTASPNVLGFRGSEAMKQLTKSERILREMEAVVPIASIPLEKYTNNPDHRNVSVKVGLVYAADAHTYLAAHPQLVIDEHRNAFATYNTPLPAEIGSLKETIRRFPTGFPEGMNADFLPLHTIIWCFVEVDGKIQPLDALTLLTGQGWIDQVFRESDNLSVEEEKIERGKKQFRTDVLVTMSEYSHVAAVALFSLYEHHFLNYVIATLEKHRQEFGLSADWVRETLRENFSLQRKGIRRHLNIGYDPAAMELGEWFGLWDTDQEYDTTGGNSREFSDLARGPASQASAHIFVREISFKKWVRLVEDTLRADHENGKFTPEQYALLNQLIQMSLMESPYWSPDKTDDEQYRVVEGERVSQLDENNALIGATARSQFIAEDPERYIKSLDPYANYEGQAIIDLLEDALLKVFRQYGVYDIEKIREVADAVKPYNRNINAITMKIPYSDDLPLPGYLLESLGEVLNEIVQVKRAYYAEAFVPSRWRYLDPVFVNNWLDKLSGYRPTRKMLDRWRGNDSDYSYDLAVESDETVEDRYAELTERLHNPKDLSRIYQQLIIQLVLYHFRSLQARDEYWQKWFREESSTTMLFEGEKKCASPKIQLIWDFLRYSSQQSKTANILEQAYKRVHRYVVGNDGLVDEFQLINFLIIRKLENERLGIRQRGQRPLNTSRLPGFLVSYNYISEPNEDRYIEFTISPVISERGSVEQIKGLNLTRMVDAVKKTMIGIKRH